MSCSQRSLQPGELRRQQHLREREEGHLSRDDDRGRQSATQPVGLARDAWQRLGVVRGLVRRVPQRRSTRPDGSGEGGTARCSRRLLDQLPGRLPFSQPRKDRAPQLELPLRFSRRACLGLTRIIRNPKRKRGKHIEFLAHASGYDARCFRQDSRNTHSSNGLQRQTPTS